MDFSSIVLLLVIALILFGPEDLPVIARALGKIVYQVRKAANELTKEFQDVVDTPKNTLNKTLESITNPSPSPKNKIDSNEWKQEDEPSKQTEEQLITYDEDKPDTAVIKTPSENPLAGLPEEVLTYDTKPSDKPDQE